MAVRPRAFRARVSAPPRRRTSAWRVWPKTTAAMRGVMPKAWCPKRWMKFLEPNRKATDHEAKTTQIGDNFLGASGRSRGAPALISRCVISTPTPKRAAMCSTLRPSRLGESVTPPARRTSTTRRRPYTTAASSAVSPRMFRASTSARRSSASCTTQGLSLAQAMIGVMPVASRALTSARLDSSSKKAPMCPWTAARCTGCMPRRVYEAGLPTRSLQSTRALASRSPCMTTSSPSSVANANGQVPSTASMGDRK
mmetsp:Transcript_6943/g.19738  ORF Transcript_6943/g.19738 Transcript_6943/m.19738 type:complete len:254 (-) Transcript_6943:1036-1797(-)